MRSARKTCDNFVDVDLNVFDSVLFEFDIILRHRFQSGDIEFPTIEKELI